MWTLSCGMWDLVPWPGIEPRLPAVGVQSLSHWTTGEVPKVWLWSIKVTSRMTWFDLQRPGHRSTKLLLNKVTKNLSFLREAKWHHRVFSLQEKAVVPGEIAEGSRPWGSTTVVKNRLGARMATAFCRTVAFLFSVLNSFSFSCDASYNLQPLCKSSTHNSFDWGVLWGWTEMLPSVRGRKDRSTIAGAVTGH